MQNDRFNSFNGLKALKHVEYWSDIKYGFIPYPRFVSLDLCGKCNLNCSFCNANKAKSSEVMSKELIDATVSQLVVWGTTSICLGGGGDSSLNPNLSYAVEELTKRNISVGLVTNGVDISNLGDISRYKWIGISVDACSYETYKNLKGKDELSKVIENIKILTSKKETEVTFKFLLHPENRFDIYYAIGIAKNIGCDQIHIRPGSYSWFDKNSNQFEFDENDYLNVEKQINTGIYEFQDDTFKVYYVPIKFDQKFKPLNSFNKCWATYTTCYISPNGTIGLCCDQRGNKKFELGKVGENVWGGEKHKQIVNDINTSKCPRCTLSHVNEIFENVILEDKMNCDFF